VGLVLSHDAQAQAPSPTKDWPSSTPAAEKMDPQALARLDADIKGGKYGFVDSMLVIRHGKIVFERAYQHDYDTIYAKEAAEPGPLNANDPTGPYNYFNPWWHPFYRRGDLHTMQSVTKTVTSIVIGVATARKEFPPLDTPVLQFFDATKVANVDDRKRRMTIRHLLTMTSGLDWDEDVPYADPRNDSSRMEASFDSPWATACNTGSSGGCIPTPRATAASRGPAPVSAASVRSISPITIFSWCPRAGTSCPTVRV
jgi:CubicO group peptidase (beta-lactamase class C family)